MTSRHRIVTKDFDAMRGVCAVCGPVALAAARTRKGTPTPRCINAKRATNRRCETARQARMTPNERGASRGRLYLLHRADRCARCGFIPQVAEQLCVHHADSDHSNNDPTNLVTLCLNCHALTHAELRGAA